MCYSDAYAAAISVTPATISVTTTKFVEKSISSIAVTASSLLIRPSSLVEIFDFVIYIYSQITDFFIGFSCNIDLKATQTVQSFSSPGFPDAYQNGVNCTWTLSSVSGSQIVVKLFNFNTEFYYDTVSVMFLFSIVFFFLV